MRRALHHDVAGALEISDEPLCDDVGYECVRVMLALPALELHHEARAGASASDSFSRSSLAATPDRNAGGRIDRADRAARPPLNCSARSRSKNHRPRRQGASGAAACASAEIGTSRFALDALDRRQEVIEWLARSFPEPLASRAPLLREQHGRGGPGRVPQGLRRGPGVRRVMSPHTLAHSGRSAASRVPLCGYQGQLGQHY
jgi:hypothetical protein